MTIQFFISALLLFTLHPQDNLQYRPAAANAAANCETVYDSLTKKIVYTNADVAAENQGGRGALWNRFERMQADSISPDSDTRFIVGFVVNIDGSISGERVIKDATNKIGWQMLNIIKSFKWSPAICNGKKVPMLCRETIQMCFSDD